MKLLCVTGYFLPDIGGMQLSTHQTLLALQRQGAEICLLAPNYLQAKEFDKTVPYKVQRFAGDGYVGAVARLIKAYFYYKKQNFDGIVLLGHHLEIAYGIISYFFTFNPIILAAGTRLSFYAIAIKKFVRNKILCRAYSQAALIIAISSATRKSILKYCANISNIPIVPRTVDEKVWNIPHKQSDIFTIVTVARLEKAKNIQSVINILYNLKQQGYINWRYWVIGDGNYYEELIKLVSKYELKNHVTFFGKIDYNVVPSYVSQADVLMLLSLRGDAETFGRVYVEAASTGTISIGYLTSGTSEAIKHGYSGYLVNEGEDDKVVNILVELINNNNLLRELSFNSVKFYEKHFTSSIVGKKLFLEIREKI